MYRYWIMIESKFIDDLFIGSLDCILYFLHISYLEKFIKNDNKNELSNLLYNIITIEKYISKIKNPSNRLSVKCYGSKDPFKEVLIKNWRKNLTIEYF